MLENYIAGRNPYALVDNLDQNTQDIEKLKEQEN